MINYIAEFLGTYILCLVILSIFKKYPNWTAQTIGIMISTLVTLILFSENEADFNPVVTLMYFLDGKRSIQQLVRFILVQILGALSAYLTVRVIF